MARRSYDKCQEAVRSLRGEDCVPRLRRESPSRSILRAGYSAAALVTFRSAGVRPAKDRDHDEDLGVVSQVARDVSNSRYVASRIAHKGRTRRRVLLAFLI